MPIQKVVDLVKLIQQFRLLDAPQLEELTRALAPQFSEPRRLAKELLDRSWLTPYQINQLFQGRGGDLVFDNFVLLERLGEGGMGQVFKAKHRKLGTLAALKIVRRDRSAGPDSIRRFKREIETVSQLIHPNVVRALDAGEVDGSHFLIMEYVEGTDLARLIKQVGPLKPSQASEYIRQAALGLQHAHEHGLVHRDIKPANLLLTKQGLVKVADMGLARRESFGEAASTALTQEGSILGTPDYIAPEQARNSSGADIRSDLYSLGCTFYFLLIGQPPFPGGALTEKLLRHQLDPLPLVKETRPEVPSAIDTVIQILTAKRPEQRFQTPGELAAVLAGKAPLPARQVGAAHTATVAQPISGTRPPSSGAFPVAGPVKNDSGLLPTVAPSTADPFSDLDTPAPISVTRVEPPRRPRTTRQPWWLLAVAAGVVVITAVLTVVGVKLLLAKAPRHPDPVASTKDAPTLDMDKDKEKERPKTISKLDPWTAAVALRKLKGRVLPAVYIPDYQPLSVDLSGTAATDADLSQLAAMPHVTLLRLTGAKITDKGLIHVGQLTKLKNLYLNGTAVTDEGLAQLKNLTELLEVDLSSTQVHGQGLTHLQGATKLRNVNLAYSKVDDEGLLGLASLPHLQQLTLQLLPVNNKQITGAGLVHLKGLTKLKSLSLVGLKLADADLAPLQNLTRLTFLDLTGTKLGDSGLSKFKSLKLLQELRAANTNLGDKGLPALAAAAKLQSVTLTGSKIQDDGLAVFKDKAELHTLYLDSTRVGDAGLQHLAGLPNLHILELEQSNVTDEGLAKLAGLKELQSLGLSRTKVRGHTLSQLKVLSKLTSLTLAATLLDDAGLAEVGQLTQVATLSLANCLGISDAGLVQLKEMKGLRTLSLSGAKIGDKGLAELKELNGLTSLNLTDTPGISQESIAALKMALPKLTVLGR